MEKIRVLIMGAAGRDFHNFNVVYRDDASVEVVAFTATQIPDIEGRGYPAELAGPPVGVAVRKYDLHTGTSTAHRLAEGRTCGEPVFVPAAGASGEDEGYLLTLVHDAAENASELVVLDATRVESEPVARVHLPTRVPAGFHGSWIAEPA